MGRLKVDWGVKSEIRELLLGTEKRSLASTWGSQREFCVLSCSSMHSVEEAEAD